MEKRVILSFALLLTTFTITWAEDVSYIYYRVIDFNSQFSLQKGTGTVSNPTVLTSTLLENSTEHNLDDGWYVLKTSFEYGERIVISGDVKLILCDGCTLTAQKGFRINTDATLSIYAQSEGDRMGKLVTTAPDNDNAGIGGDKNFRAGLLYIHGGEIEATSAGKYAAGIGGGYGDGRGMKAITIYGGKVTATGGAGGAGIGGGANRGNWPVNIYGGTVIAEGRTDWAVVWYGGAGIGSGDGADQTARISIYGGTVKAESYNAAGIGGGYKGKGGEVYIYGGTVTAMAGSGSAGIGGGCDRDGGDVRISGGTVTAENLNDGAAIGGGNRADGGRIEITGGHVKTITHKFYGLGSMGAFRGKAACNIGCGRTYGQGSETIILDKYICVKPQSGLVMASKRVEACKGPRTGSDDEQWTIEVYECGHDEVTYSYINESGHTAHCKYCEYTKNEEHSMVAPNSTCEKCGYSSEADICTLSFYQTETESASGYMTSGTLYVKGQTISLPECTKIPEGMTFAGWIIADLSVINGIEAADEEPLHPAGEEYTVTGNASFFARYRHDFTPTWTWSDFLTSATLTIQAAGGAPISVTPVTVGEPTYVAATPDEMGSITNTATATYKSGDDMHGYTTYSFSTEHSVPQYYEYALQDIYDNTPTLSTYNGRLVMCASETGRSTWTATGTRSACPSMWRTSAARPSQEPR